MRWSKQVKLDLQKDAELVTKGFQVQWVLEQGASKRVIRLIERYRKHGIHIDVYSGKMFD